MSNTTNFDKTLGKKNVNVGEAIMNCKADLGKSLKEQLIDVYREADIFVMPSTAREGLARSVIEAMAQGVPAIVSDIGGLPEIVRNRKDGFVVKGGDVEALANALDKLVSNEKLLNEFSKSAKERIEKSFNTLTTQEKLLSLYKVLSGKR